MLFAGQDQGDDGKEVNMVVHNQGGGGAVTGQIS